MFRENSIAVAIARLRKKLKDKFEIENIYGNGYIMKPNALDTFVEKTLNSEDEEDEGVIY